MAIDKINIWQNGKTVEKGKSDNLREIDEI